MIAAPLLTSDQIGASRRNQSIQIVLWDCATIHRALKKMHSREYSDDALAQAFATFYGDDLRYTAAWGRWSIWNGHAWKTDDTRRVLDMAREVCREESESCKDEKLPEHWPPRGRLRPSNLAQADHMRHAAKVDQWDADLWILNTPGSR